MAYPAKLLADGERIEFEMRPHWRSLVVPAIVLVLVVAVTTYLLTVLPDGDTGKWLRWGCSSSPSACSSCTSCVR